MDSKECLKEVKKNLGRSYKAAIRRAWMTGDYAGEGLDDYAARLQQIRNSHGPTWLANVRV